MQDVCAYIVNLEQRPLFINFITVKGEQLKMPPLFKNFHKCSERWGGGWD